MASPQSELELLPNIGRVTAGWLHDAGIRTAQDLEVVGPVEAWRRVKAVYPNQVTLVLLYALQGALLGIHWNDLPRDLKQRLKSDAQS
ncbi:MAG: TfoX/Sxy family protein [Chloroflexota bacterium]|nr:TfoX/Sxy family protein [Chloroflexota bacterium]